MAVNALPVLLALAAAIVPAAAQSDRADRVQNPMPRLETNEHEIVEALRPSALAIDDPLAVFGYVLENLPERVRVYPTENYYYVRFMHNGVRHAGNIRFAASDRDQGKVHFAYGEEPSEGRPAPETRHVVLDASRGVAVAKLGPLAYRVTHQGRGVTFALNDLTQVKPPQDLLRQDETSLGPIFDESAIRFFLVFNSRLKVFHYLLDETAGVADRLDAVAANPSILIGMRTGFAFYRDGARKILVGVLERNSRLNNQFDGPFDQLPENFIEGEALREVIVAADPGSKGRIDRLGNFIDGSDRYLIHPYRLYRTAADLAVFQRCATSKRVAAADRPRCFVIDDDEAQKKNPLPLALKRR